MVKVVGVILSLSILYPKKGEKDRVYKPIIRWTSIETMYFSNTSEVARNGTRFLGMEKPAEPM